MPSGAKVFPMLLSRLDYIHPSHPRVDRIRRETSSERVWVLNALPGIPGTGASPTPQGEFGFVDAGAFVSEIHTYLLTQSPVLREFYVDLKARNVRKKRAKFRPPPPGGVDETVAAAQQQPNQQPTLGTLAQIIRLEFKQASFLAFASYALPADHPTRQEAVRAYESALSYIHEYLANSLGIDAARARNVGNACALDSPRWLELIQLADAVSFHLIRGQLVAAAAPNAPSDALSKALTSYRNQILAFSALPEFGWEVPSSMPSAEGKELVPPGLALPRGGGTPLFWAWLAKYPPLFSSVLAALPGLSRTIDARYLPQPPGPLSAREAMAAIGESFGKTFGPGMGGWGWWDALGAGMVEMRCKKATQGVNWANSGAAVSGTPTASAGQLSATDSARSLVTVTRQLSTPQQPQPDSILTLCKPHIDALPLLAARAIDLLTRSYEYYKNLGRTRWTVYLAGRIGRVYSGWDGMLPAGNNGGRNPGMAGKFWERVGKSYRGGWDRVLGDVAEKRVDAGLAGLEGPGVDRKKMWTGVVEGLVEGLMTVGGSGWEEQLKGCLDKWSGEGSGEEVVVDMEGIVAFGGLDFERARICCAV